MTVDEDINESIGVEFKFIEHTRLGKYLFKYI